MKQLIYTLLLLGSTATNVLAQPLADNKRDYIWLFGELNQLYNAGDTSYGGAYMDFRTNPPLLYKQPKRMNFSITSSSIADSLGNLFAYSNGISIADRTHQTMMNGDSIGYDPDFWELYENRGMTGAKSMTLLPINNVLLALYYTNVITQWAPGGGDALFTYSLIDMKLNNEGV